MLAAFAKYPRSSVMAGADKARISEKKFGYCAHDADNFRLVAEATGLVAKGDGAWCRHPLAFLMEAADDICYGIVDLEDGHSLGRVSFADTRDLMWPIAFPAGQLPGPSYDDIGEDTGRIEYLRARAIGNLIQAEVAVFKQHYDAIMAGRFEQDLVSHCKFAADLKRISAASRTQIYATPAVLQIEAAGYDILGGLLNKIVPPLLSPEAGRSNAHKKILQILPKQFTTGSTPYQRLLAATDFISGMTDSYALTLFRRLHGMELPGAAI